MTANFRPVNFKPGQDHASECAIPRQMQDVSDSASHKQSLAMWPSRFGVSHKQSLAMCEWPSRFGVSRIQSLPHALSDLNSALHAFTHSIINHMPLAIEIRRLTDSIIRYTQKCTLTCTRTKQIIVLTDGPVRLLLTNLYDNRTMDTGQAYDRQDYSHLTHWNLSPAFHLCEH